MVIDEIVEGINMDPILKTITPDEDINSNFFKLLL